MPQRATFRVPRLYKAAAKVSSVIKNENGNLEQLVEQYNKKTNAKPLGALVSKIVKNEDLLDKIIENSQILVKEPKEDPWLFRVLIAELLLGKQRLPIGSKTIQTVLSHGPVLRTELMKAQGKHVGKHKTYIGEDFDNGASSELTKIKESESAEFSDNIGIGMKSQKKKKNYNIETSMEEEEYKSTSKKSQKLKKDDQKSMEEDNSQYKPKLKKLKKSKKKRKGNQEIVLDRNEEDHTMDESIDADELMPKSMWDKQLDYIKLEDDNNEPTSVEHKPTKKKGKKNKQYSESSAHKKRSTKIKSPSKK